MTSFAVTLCGQCCRLRVVGQQVVSDISVIGCCSSICSLCFESNNTSLLLLLLIDVRETSILLQMPNIACRIQHDGVYLVTMDTEFSAVTARYQ